MFSFLNPKGSTRSQPCQINCSVSISSNEDLSRIPKEHRPSKQHYQNQIEKIKRQIQVINLQIKQNNQLSNEVQNEIDRYIKEKMAVRQEITNLKQQEILLTTQLNKMLNQESNEEDVQVKKSIYPLRIDWKKQLIQQQEQRLNQIQQMIDLTKMRFQIQMQSMPRLIDYLKEQKRRLYKLQDKIRKLPL